MFEGEPGGQQRLGFDVLAGHDVVGELSDDGTHARWGAGTNAGRDSAEPMAEAI